jgi:hypothetical protein
MGDRDYGDRDSRERRFSRGGHRGSLRESSRCHTPGCIKYHDFFQWNGKYYCLECYETLRQHAADVATGALEAAAEA